MDKLDFPGVVLPRTPEVLALYSQQLLTVLSSAVIGGGMVRVRYLLNRHVRHDYNCLAPGADLVAFARSQSISEAFVGQKAGVSLQKARTSIGNTTCKVSRDRVNKRWPLRWQQQLQNVFTFAATCQQRSDQP
jgi:Adenosylcobinamide amidohydrolase